MAEGQHPDVGPHPHIALATVTSLVAAEDRLGSVQLIRPGGAFVTASSTTTSARASVRGCAP